jgi:hypothetical protein
MNDSKKLKKHSQPSKATKPVTSPRPESATPAITITTGFTEEVHERAEMITPFLADILSRPVTSHWGINE